MKDLIKILGYYLAKGSVVKWITLFVSSFFLRFIFEEIIILLGEFMSPETSLCASQYTIFNCADFKKPIC